MKEKFPVQSIHPQDADSTPGARWQKIVAEKRPLNGGNPAQDTPWLAIWWGNSVQPPVFGPPFKLVSGDAFSAPSALLPKVLEVDNSELFKPIVG